MNGLPTSLTTVGLAKAGSQDPFASALNYQGIQNGSITKPDASTITSANSYTPSNQSNTDDHPILSASGQYVSSKTGQAWHGSYANPNGTTQYYSNGQPVQDIGMVGVQKPNIQVQAIAKDPALSSQVSGAIGANGQTAGMLSKSFNQMLQEAQHVTDKQGAQLKQSQAAIDPSATIARVNNDVSTVGNQLGRTLNDYGVSQNANLSNVAGANSAYQTNQNAALGTLKSDLTNENSAYAAAARNVAAQAYANAAKQTNLYHLTSGTPTSNSGALSNRYMSEFNTINVPLQQDLANRNLAQTNQLYSLGSNLQDRYLGNNLNLFSQQGALNTDLANRGNSNNQYMAGLDQDTAKYIQSLTQQVATMQPQLAQQYLTSLGIPFQIAQQIIAGNTQNLQALSNLDQSANNYNFYAPGQNNAPSYVSPRISIPSSGNGTGTGYNNYSGGGMAPLVSQSNSALNDYQAQQAAWLQTDAGKAWQYAQGRPAPAVPNMYSSASTTSPLVNNVPNTEATRYNDWAYTH